MAIFMVFVDLSGQFGSNRLLIGFSLNINVNDGQNKFEVHISKTKAKIANFKSKIGQDATYFLTLNGHNLAKLYLILFKISVFDPFLLRGLRWAVLHA